MQNNLLLELRFDGLGYRQTLKAYEYLTVVFKEELGREDIRYRRLETFFSKYRICLWLRRGDEDNHQVRDRITEAIGTLLARFKSHLPEAWEQTAGLLVLANEDLLPITVGNLSSDRKTSVGSKLLKIKDTQHYWREMNRYKVLIDNGQREKYIRQLLADTAASVGGIVISSPILNEVVVTCEQPVVKSLDFATELLQLPEELTLIIMEKNYCFGLRSAEGGLLGKSIFICNKDCEVPDLSTTLMSAMKDYLTDLDKPMAARLEEMQKLCYLTGLGSYFDKQKRLQKIVLTVADQIDAGENVCNLARQASEFAKIDLTTQTCSVYPEFQGYLGGIIARQEGGSEAVALAIYEHLCPGPFSRKLPHTLVGALLGIADRLDDICGHYHQGEVKLSHHRKVKRWFDEIIAIIDSVALDISMIRMLKFALSLYESQRLVPWREKDLAYLHKVFTDRLYYYLLEQNYPEGISSALTVINPDNVLGTLDKARTMTDSDGEEELEGCIEVCKILDRTYAQECNLDEAAREFLEHPEEKDLFEVYLITKSDVADDIGSRRYSSALARLAKLKTPLTRFVENVDLDTDDQPVRFNRLCLIAEIRHLYHQFADFSLI